MLRVIYMVEVISDKGELVSRQFARSKELANRLAKKYSQEWIIIRPLQKTEWGYINLTVVAGITEQEIEQYCKMR